MSAPYKLMIVEDQTIMLESLQLMLNSVPILNVVATALDGSVAINHLKTQEVDVIVMDYQMPIMNGYEASKIILKEYPGMKIIILTMHNHFDYTNKLIEAGVHGIILKDSSKKDLVEAIEKVMEGDIVYSREISNKYMEGSRQKQANEKKLKKSRLSDRETQILTLIAQGKSTEEISTACSISTETVGSHRKNIYRKTGCKTVAELTVKAIKMGLIDI